MKRAYVILSAGKATRLESVETRSKILTQLEEAPVIRDHACIAHAVEADVVVIVCTPGNASDPWFNQVCTRAFDPHAELIITGREPDGGGPAITQGLRVAQDAGCDNALVVHADTVVSIYDALHIIRNCAIGVASGAIHPSTVQVNGKWTDGVDVDLDTPVYMGVAWCALDRHVPWYKDIAHFLNSLCIGWVDAPSWRDVGDIAALRMRRTVETRGGAEVTFDGTHVIKKNAGIDLARLPPDIRPAIIDDDTIERLSMRTVADLWLFEPRFNLQRATEDTVIALQRLHSQEAQGPPSCKSVAEYQFARIDERFEGVQSANVPVFADDEWYDAYTHMARRVWFKFGGYTPRYITLTHGDPNFANVFYDTRLGSVKFIDPRDEARAFGDPEYDIAKVWYSVVLDFCSITLGLPWRRRSIRDVKIIEDVIIAAGYDIDRIRRLGILLSLAGIPCHKAGESDMLTKRLFAFWEAYT